MAPGKFELIKSRFFEFIQPEDDARNESPLSPYDIHLQALIFILTELSKGNGVGLDDSLSVIIV